METETATFPSGLRLLTKVISFRPHFLGGLFFLNPVSSLPGQSNLTLPCIQNRTVTLDSPSFPPPPPTRLPQNRSRSILWLASQTLGAVAEYRGRSRTDLARPEHRCGCLKATYLLSDVLTGCWLQHAWSSRVT